MLVDVLPHAPAVETSVESIVLTRQLYSSHIEEIQEHLQAIQDLHARTDVGPWVDDLEALEKVATKADEMSYALDD